MDNISNSSDASSESVAPVSAASAPSPKNKQGGRILIVTILALLVGAAGATAVIVGINGGFDFGKKTSSGNTSKPESVDVAEEKEITDKDLSSKIAVKTNRVFASVDSDKQSLSGFDEGTSFSVDPDISKYKDLSSEMKSRIVLARFWATDEILLSEIPDSVMSKQTKEQAHSINTTTTSGIKINYTVKNYYKELFGDEMTEFPDSISNNLYFDTCGMKYASSIEAYVIPVLGCGGSTSTFPEIYQYKYTEQGDNAYAYFALAQFDGDKEEWSELGNKNGEKIDGVSGSKITADNYAKLPHYKATFEKQSDGNYIYKTVEKVND